MYLYAGRLDRQVVDGRDLVRRIEAGVSRLSDFLHTYAYFVSKPCSCVTCRLTSRPAYKRANGQKRRPALSVDAQVQVNEEMMRHLSIVDCLVPSFIRTVGPDNTSYNDKCSTGCLSPPTLSIPSPRYTTIVCTHTYRLGDGHCATTHVLVRLPNKYRQWFSSVSRAELLRCCFTT